MIPRRIKEIKGPIFQCPYCKQIFATKHGAKTHVARFCPAIFGKVLVIQSNANLSIKKEEKQDE